MRAPSGAQEATEEADGTRHAHGEAPVLGTIHYSVSIELIVSSSKKVAHSAMLSFCCVLLLAAFRGDQNEKWTREVTLIISHFNETIQSI